MNVQFKDMTQQQLAKVQAWCHNHHWGCDVVVSTEGIDFGHAGGGAGHLDDEDVKTFADLRAWAGY